MSEEDVRDLFRPVLPVSVRRMFGGLGIYDGERIFALVAGGELFLKVDAETRAAFEAAGSTPFVYEGGPRPSTMPYWRLPDPAFDDEDELRGWTALARAAAARAAARPPVRRRPRRAAG